MFPRPPIVTILGHVDHGKTTLLDYIRKSNITQKEHGGITQKIGAYEITTNFKDYKTNKITFIDTPGHEAFSRLRARGANVSDLAILLIDGKDSLMPQTIESISHIKNAGIPFIVVINKIDLPEINVEKVKADLLKYEVLVEGKGGNIPVIPLSAKTGKGVKELLEAILLISEDLNLSYQPTQPLKAYLIETKKDKGGVVASVIIKDGSIKIGDSVYYGEKKIKVKSMINDQGVNIEKALPSTPFELLGFSDLPEVGTVLESQPKKTSHQPLATKTIGKKLDLESLLKPTEEKKLLIIIKANSQGSLEAINQSLTENDNIEVVLKAVGEVNQSDVFLAKTTKAIIIGFGVNPTAEAKELAKQEKVIIKTYQIIYELLEELTEVTGLLKEKEEQQKNLKGEAKILANFIIEGEKVYGVKVTKGKINLSDELQAFKNNQSFGKTKLVSLKIRAKAVNEVKKGDEAGMIFSPKLDITIGDMIKSIL